MESYSWKGLVDGLILLAALASGNSGNRRGLIEELHWLETTPPRVRQRFRRQLAQLLGCLPQQALLESARLISRYRVTEHSRTTSGLSKGRTVALPISGNFLERHPELGSLRDLLALLESLQVVRLQQVARWSQLPGPLPAGLGTIRKLEKDLEDEALEMYSLRDEALGDLIREAFSGSDFEPERVQTFQEELGQEEANGLGYDLV